MGDSVLDIGGLDVAGVCVATGPTVAGVSGRKPGVSVIGACVGIGEVSAGDPDVFDSGVGGCVVDGTGVAVAD